MSDNSNTNTKGATLQRTYPLAQPSINSTLFVEHVKKQRGKWGFGATPIIVHHYFLPNGVTCDARPRVRSLYSRNDVNADREYLVKGKISWVGFKK